MWLWWQQGSPKWQYSRVVCTIAYPRRGQLKCGTRIALVWQYSLTQMQAPGGGSAGLCKVKECGTYIHGVVNVKELLASLSAGIFAEYNQQDATFLNLFISVRRSTCFRRGSPSIIRRSNCAYSVRHLSDRYCYLLPAWTGCSSIGLTNTWRSMCSFELLMMDGIKPSETCRASYRNK